MLLREKGSCDANDVNELRFVKISRIAGGTLFLLFSHFEAARKRPETPAPRNAPNQAPSEAPSVMAWTRTHELDPRPRENEAENRFVRTHEQLEEKKKEPDNKFQHELANQQSLLDVQFGLEVADEKNAQDDAQFVGEVLGGASEEVCRRYPLNAQISPLTKSAMK